MKQMNTIPGMTVAEAVLFRLTPLTMRETTIVMMGFLVGGAGDAGGVGGAGELAGFERRVLTMV